MHATVRRYEGVDASRTDELTKLLLSISNRSVGGRLVSLQSLHLPGGLVLHAGAVECARVALKAIGIGSLLAQRWQRSRQFIASPL